MSGACFSTKTSTQKINDELKKRDQDFIITAPRNMGAFEDLMMGTEL